MTHHAATSEKEAKLGPLFLGIDVGGTNVKLGLVDDDGTVRCRATTPTPDLKTPRRIFDYAMEFAWQELKCLSRSTADLAGVGLAVPGVLDTRAYVLREVVNLPGWHGEPLMEILSNAAKLPAAVVNDANSAAYAEHSLRRLGDRSLALVTLGTGIGCGLVIGGKPYGGDHGCAGELGHIAIRFGDDALPCTCGSRGHLETYAGAGGLIRRLRLTMQENPTATFPDVLQSSDVTPLMIAEHAEQGSTFCQQLIDETAQYVGQAIGMIGQVIDPEVVLLGGAMTFGGSASPIGRRFLEHVRESVRATTLVQVGTKMQIDFATLGNDAGVLGAAMIAKQVCQP
ncbi:MAG: ROK family protein [Planctomycetota bacterium]